MQKVCCRFFLKIKIKIVILPPVLLSHCSDKSFYLFNRTAREESVNCVDNLGITLHSQCGDWRDEREGGRWRRDLRPESVVVVSCYQIHHNIRAFVRDIQ